MGTSQRLRMRDVEAVYRLVDECREVGADARVWQRHLLSELSRLTGSHVGAACEAAATSDRMITNWPTAIDVGWTDADRQRTADLAADGFFSRDEFCLRLVRSFAGSRGEALTRTRQQLIDDASWLRTETWDCYRHIGVTDLMMSIGRVADRSGIYCIGFPHLRDERAVGLREARVVELCFRLIRPHLGKGLALLGEPGVVELSPRRRQVLAGLLDGLAEKQIARRLDLSLATVHEYVTGLYRHFGVSSRGELMALFLRRQNGPAGEWIERFQA